MRKRSSGSQIVVVNGGKSNAEKACEICKKMQKGNLDPPCAFVMFGNETFQEQIQGGSKKKQQKEAVAPRWYRGMGKEQCRERVQKHER